MKLAGEVSLYEGAGQVLEGVSCAGPGQIITTFENTPQLPFERSEARILRDARAPLATPALCGAYTTESTFVPWSARTRGDSSAHPPASFPINSRSRRQLLSIRASLPFSPSLSSGSTNIDAGVFSNLDDDARRAKTAISRSSRSRCTTRRVCRGRSRA